MRRTAIAVITLCVCSLLGSMLLAAPAGAAGSRMQFTFIQYDPSGPDTNSNAQINREYVTISNTSGDRISVAGWHLYDYQNHAYALPSITLGPYTKIRIHTGIAANADVDKYWNLSYYVWNNTGDRARLRDNKNGLVDECSWNHDASSGYTSC